MKSQQDVRELLIGNTIRLIAEGGFEKATTKAITYSGGPLPEVKMNEVYIYRLFGSKERLYEAAFERLDSELTDAMYASVHAGDGDTSRALSETLYEVFLKIWRFVLKNETQCRCYVRYYYSVYFKGDSLERHNRHFEGIIRAFSPLFKEEADVGAIMHSVLTTLLDFAVRVYNGDLEDSDVNTPHVFNVLYCTMAGYFKSEYLPTAKLPQIL